MHDNDIGQPDPLRWKVFGPEQMPDGERLGYAIEFAAQLDDRLKELENFVTNLVTQDVQPEAGDDE